MKTFHCLSITLLAALLLVYAVAVRADIPRTITYQGRMTDSDGSPITDGTYGIAFVIYGSESGSDTLWHSGMRPVDIMDGLFTYQLGHLVPFPDDLFSGTPRYLGITFGPETESSPRTELTSAAYAFQTLRSDSSEYAATVGYDCIESNQIVDRSINGNDIAIATLEGFHLQNGTITFIKMAPNDAEDGEVMKMIGGNWNAAPDETGGNGTITSVTPTDLGGLEGGGTEGDVSLGIAVQGVTSGLIQDGAIIDEDVNQFAAIAPDKIAGTAVTVSGDQLIEGTKTFDNLNIATTTRRTTISSAAFVPGNSSYEYNRSGSYIVNTSTGLQTYFAPVSLPDGAIVTAVRVTFHDNDATYDAYFELSKVYLYSTGVVYMASGSSAGTPGLTTVVDNTIISESISNDGYVYYLTVEMHYSGSNLNMRLYGAEIEYTITRPLP
jgi:hypothetical protein